MNIQKDNKVGKYFWFEYHCYESDDSCDEEIWYRSHQKVKILSVSEWSFDNLQDRIDDGQPRVYKVMFNDGLKYDVYEDELMNSTEDFYRPNPPIKNLQESIRRIVKEETEQNYIFVRTDDFDNIGTIRKIPYDGIHCWCIYEDDFDKYIEELELWGGSRKKVRIVDGDNYKKYAINYKMTHDYVMGDSDEIPELENFNPNKHIMKFIKQGKKSMLSYVADIRYQIILL
jgi:hypothetical protein